MTRVRVESFTVSLDGYGAGPDQGANNPLGVGGDALATPTFGRELRLPRCHAMNRE
jgi:hypothetical protein